jgi:hypothetical protein
MSFFLSEERIPEKGKYVDVINVEERTLCE